MDDITTAKLDRFRKAIAQLKPSTKAMLDWLYDMDINMDEVKAPEVLYESFMQVVIALDRRNNGEFSLEEGAALIEIDSTFKSLFKTNAEMGGLVNVNDAFNKAQEKIWNIPPFKKYVIIIHRLEEQDLDDLISKQSAEELAEAKEFAKRMEETFRRMGFVPGGGS